MQHYPLLLFAIHLIFFTNKGQIGCLDIIEHQQLYVVKKLYQS